MPSSLNGTGVTFNDGTTLQSGNIPAANLGSGTANVSTVLRGNRTFGAPPAPTTDQVLSAYAGASAGGVGTYTVAYFPNVTASQVIAIGTTIAGSSLQRSSALDAIGEYRANSGGGVQAGGFSGTWRVMHRLRNGFTDTRSIGGLFLRIS